MEACDAWISQLVENDMAADEAAAAAAADGGAPAVTVR